MYFVTITKERALCGFRFDEASTPDGPRLVALWKRLAEAGSAAATDSLARFRFAVRFRDLLHTCLWRFAHNDALDVAACLTIDVPSELATYDWGVWVPLAVDEYTVTWLSGETLFYTTV